MESEFIKRKFLKISSLAKSENITFRQIISWKIMSINLTWKDTYIVKLQNEFFYYILQQIMRLSNVLAIFNFMKKLSDILPNERMYIFIPLLHFSSK